jgi:ribosomal protein L11
MKFVIPLNVIGVENLRTEEVELQQFPIGQLKVLIPSGEAKGGAPLGPLLGQYQININEFCKEFNKASEGYENGVYLRVFFWKSSEAQFLIFIKGPKIEFLLYNSFLADDDSCYGVVDVEQLFNIIFYNSLFYRSSLRGYAKNVLGFLRSWGISIKF